MIAIVGADQLRRHPDFVALPPNAAFENVSDIESRANRSQVFVLVLELNDDVRPATGNPSKSTTTKDLSTQGGASKFSNANSATCARNQPMTA